MPLPGPGRPHGLGIEKRLGNERGRATTLSALGGFEAEQGQPEVARRLYQESLDIQERLGNEQGRLATLSALGDLEAEQGRPEEARRLYQESLDIAARLKNERDRALTLHRLAGLQASQGQRKEAGHLYRESLAIQERLGNQRGRVATLHALAELEASEGRAEEARRLYRESLAINEDELGRAATILALASLDLKGDPKRALQLAEQGVAVLAEVGGPLMAAHGRLVRAGARLATGDSWGFMADLLVARRVRAPAGLAPRTDRLESMVPLILGLASEVFLEPPMRNRATLDAALARILLNQPEEAQALLEGMGRGGAAPPLTLPSAVRLHRRVPRGILPAEPGTRPTQTRM